MAKKGKYVYEWPRPTVSVDVLVFSKGQDNTKLLLIKRGREPFKQMWSLPGGFLEMDEELEDAAARELQEETQLTGVKLEQMYTFGTIGRDPRGRQVTIAFIGIIKNEPEVKGGDDAADAKWFDIKELPNMGFDHNDIVKMAIESIRAGNE